MLVCRIKNTHTSHIRAWHVLQTPHWMSCAAAGRSAAKEVEQQREYSLGVLVDVDRAVESFQLSHQQLKVGINVAQLQKHHVFNLVV